MQVYTGCASVQLPNHRPGKLDMLSQHAKYSQGNPACNCPITGQGSKTHYKYRQAAVTQSWAREAGHTIPACSWDQSQVGKVRHAIPACTMQTSYPCMHCKNMHCIKEAAKAQKQWTSWHSKIAVEPEETHTRGSRASSYNTLGG